MKTIKPISHRSIGPITVDCGRDKSLTHRAIMFSSLAQGDSEIDNPLLGADCISTIDCFRKLGVQIEVQGRSVKISSPGFQLFQSSESSLDCGNSGTTARLLLGLFAGINGLKVTLTGDKSLSKRPMDRVVEPLRQTGAIFAGESGAKYLPITIEGQNLKATNYTINKSSAQVKSALMLAHLPTTGKITVTLPAGSRDHTEKMLIQMGANCQSSVNQGIETVIFTGPFYPHGQKYNIPVDPSSAAFFSVLGLLRPKGKTLIPDVLNNPTRTGYLNALMRMSSHIKCQKAATGNLFVEATMNLDVEGSFPLVGTDISAAEIPTLVDEIPILAVAAAFASSPSRFSGLSELRIKESDRLAKTYELLQAAGARCSIEGDDLVIFGGLKQANSFHFNPEEDHRMAMAAAIIACFAKSPCKILDEECVAVSFPNFFEELKKFES